MITSPKPSQPTPWPSERPNGAQPQRIRSFTWEWHLDSPPERLWPLVSDTDLVNRHAGMPAVKYRFVPSETGGSETHAEVRLLGLIPACYRERPFEWEENRRYAVRREFISGPLHWYTAALELFPEAHGTHLVQTVTFCLRWRFIAPILSLAARRTQKSYTKIYNAFSRRTSAQDRPEVSTPKSLSLEERALKRLEAVDPSIDRELKAILARHIATAEGRDLQRIRPFALANRFGRERNEMLEACLSAVKAGALDLSWNLLCPHCRDAKKQAATLEEVTAEAYCEACNINYEVEFDRSLEATFSPSPSLRRVRDDIYCIGGPRNTPHIVRRIRVEAGGACTDELHLAAGAYRIRCTKSAAYVSLRVGAAGAPAPGGDAAGATVQASPEKLSPSTLTVPEGKLRLCLRNETPEEAAFDVESAEWANDAATALDVAFFEPYRRLFGPDAFRSGERIAVNNVTLLFTDLKSSTQMYESIGDAVAFGLVREHFSLLQDAVQRCGGHVVKTIGDAVMAMFHAPAEALRAAFDIHEAIARRHFGEEDAPLTLKMGIHAGHCIAVNMNGRLDFFGRSVNVAARAEGESLGGDVVVTKDVLDDPDVSSFLAKAPHRREAFRAALKGLADDMTLYRLRPLVQDEKEGPSA